MEGTPENQNLSEEEIYRRAGEALRAIPEKQWGTFVEAVNWVVTRKPFAFPAFQRSTGNRKTKTRSLDEILKLLDDHGRDTN